MYLFVDVANKNDVWQDMFPFLSYYYQHHFVSKYKMFVYHEGSE